MKVWIIVEPAGGNPFKILLKFMKWKHILKKRPLLIADVRSGIDKAAHVYCPSPERHQVIASIKLYQSTPSTRAHVEGTRTDTEHFNLGLSRTARVSPPIIVFEVLRRVTVTCGLQWINILFRTERTLAQRRGRFLVKNHSRFRSPGSVQPSGASAEENPGPLCQSRRLLFATL